jgi:hypothetical protein
LKHEVAVGFGSLHAAGADKGAPGRFGRCVVAGTGFYWGCECHGV